MRTKSGWRGSAGAALTLAVSACRSGRRRPPAHGDAGLQRREREGFQSVGQKGWHHEDRHLVRLGLGRPRRHLLRPVVEPGPPVRPCAGDVQAGPGTESNELVAGPRRGAGHAERRRQDLDLQAPRRRQVRGRHADHVQGRRSTRCSRSIDEGHVRQWAGVLREFLDLQGYKGPYTDPGVKTPPAITTPDDQTIVFHLKQPFGGFDYFAMLPQPHRCRRPRTPV